MIEVRSAKVKFGDDGFLYVNGEKIEKIFVDKKELGKVNQSIGESPKHGETFLYGELIPTVIYRYVPNKDRDRDITTTAVIDKKAIIVKA